MVGTDIAELLLRDHRTVWLPGKSPNEANLIDFTNEAVEQVEEEESGEAQLSFLTDSQAASTLEKDTERFRELLLYGRKKVSDPRWWDTGAGPVLGAERPAEGPVLPGLARTCRLWWLGLSVAGVGAAGSMLGHSAGQRPRGWALLCVVCLGVSTCTGQLRVFSRSRGELAVAAVSGRGLC